MKKLWLLLIFTSFCTFGNDDNTVNTADNKTIDTKVAKFINDPRIGEQYIPYKIYRDVKADSYLFIDRKSITLHPYNQNIRVFNEIINFTPDQESKDPEQPKIIYRSVVYKQYVNCNNKEIAQGTMQIFENYFGEGKLIDADDTPNRWIKDDKKSDQHNLIIIACSLPLTNQQKAD